MPFCYSARGCESENNLCFLYLIGFVSQHLGLALARQLANIRNEHKACCFFLLKALVPSVEASEQVLFLCSELTVGRDPFIDCKPVSIQR